MLTVILLSHNRPDDLTLAIKSILCAFSKPPFVLISDDSTPPFDDKVFSVVTSFELPHILHYHHYTGQSSLFANIIRATSLLPPLTSHVLLLCDDDFLSVTKPLSHDFMENIIEHNILFFLQGKSVEKRKDSLITIQDAYHGWPNNTLVRRNTLKYFMYSALWTPRLPALGCIVPVQAWQLVIRDIYVYDNEFDLALFGKSIYMCDGLCLTSDVSYCLVSHDDQISRHPKPSRLFRSFIQQIILLQENFSLLYMLVIIRCYIFAFKSLLRFNCES